MSVRMFAFDGRETDFDSCLVLDERGLLIGKLVVEADCCKGAPSAFSCLCLPVILSKTLLLFCPTPSLGER